MKTAETTSEVAEPPQSALARLFASPLNPQTAERNSVRRPRTASEWGRFLLLAIQLAFVILVIERFQLESRAFARLSLVVVGGFLVHTFLPSRLRMAFVALLSMVGIAVVLGPRNGAAVVGVGLTVIALCHLPGPFYLRVGVLIAFGALLALMRADLVDAPFSSAIWPILGSLLMFRVIIYLYDHSHGERSKSIWETLSYFFLLPNVCFPLFPVVDYKTFRRTYYNTDAWQCAQTGVRWISRGLVHLILYRAVYYYGILDADEVVSGADLFRYIFTNFALYLRVSGNFHIAIGMLRLFGFGLPETNFLYFVTASINDWWRRANIYWKDFMLKVFYLPMFFRLRKKGENRAIILSTLMVVVATWGLHSYQWYWLRGSFLARWQDTIFWVILATLMISNTLWENRHSGARGLHAQATGLRAWLGRSGRVFLTFTFICFMWSFWTSESFSSWIGMITLSGAPESAPSPAGSYVVVGMFVCILLVGSALSGQPKAAGKATNKAFFTDVGLSAATLLGLLALGAQPVYSRFGETAVEVVQSLEAPRLNRIDAQKLERGYYEDLQNVDQFNSELWTVFKSKPAGWLELRETRAMQPSKSFIVTELVPSIEIEYKGAPMRVNQWGMRDKEYTKSKPPGTHRTVLIGGSMVMGSGVSNEETFEALVERRLNAERPLGQDSSFEILNLAVGGYSPLQRVLSFEERGIDFDPDALIYVAHENETYRLFRHLAAARNRGMEPPYEELRAIYDEAGVASGGSADAFEKALEPFAERILGLTYRRAVELCREKGIRPLWVLLPTIEMYGDPEDLEWMRRLADEAGFEVIELFGVFRGHDPAAVRIAAWDYHPNTLGHELIAGRLYESLTVPGGLYGAP